MSGKITRRGGGKITLNRGKSSTPARPRAQIISSSGRVILEKKVDVVFVFDTTGSMSDKIRQLIATCKKFTDEAEELHLDLHYALIAFGDISVQGGGDTIELVVPLTGDVQRMKAGFSQIPRNNGFGNYGETSLEAIQKAFTIEHRKGAVKVLVLLTDEPALQYSTDVESIMQELTEREYLVFVAAIDTPYYRKMAERHGGTWMEIGPDTSLKAIMEMFSQMAEKISEVAKEVHVLADGDVKEYLALTAPDRT